GSSALFGGRHAVRRVVFLSSSGSGPGGGASRSPGRRALPALSYFGRFPTFLFDPSRSRERSDGQGDSMNRRDLIAGGGAVAALIPFVRHLAENGLSFVGAATAEESRPFDRPW